MWYMTIKVRSLFEFDNFEEQLRDIDKSLQELRDDVDIAERESKYIVPYVP